jgi:hypothetical protein
MSGDRKQAFVLLPTTAFACCTLPGSQPSSLIRRFHQMGSRSRSPTYIVGPQTIPSLGLGDPTSERDFHDPCSIYPFHREGTNQVQEVEQ